MPVYLHPCWRRHCKGTESTYKFVVVPRELYSRLLVFAVFYWLPPCEPRILQQRCLLLLLFHKPSGEDTDLVDLVGKVQGCHSKEEEMVEAMVDSAQN